MCRRVAGIVGLVACAYWLASGLARAAESLTTLHYEILGTQLHVSPATVSVPKGVPGSILVQLMAGDGSTDNVESPFGGDAYVEAILRGPAFPARRLVGRPGEALMLPAISLVGDYQLDGIRLVDAATGETRLEGSPSSVPVHVFDQVLVSSVTSRPLTMQEITDRGIVIDANNFRAVEFEVAFALDGQTIRVKLPVVAPDFAQSTELIPRDELVARLVQAQQVNDQLVQQMAEQGGLPRELQRPGLNIQVKGVNFQVSEGEVRGLNLRIPPIPALLVIPGNIGYLNQFFSVQIFTENGAPPGSGLSVFDLTAKLNLPPGRDAILSTDYEKPGDDPLRFARVGPQAEIHDTVQLFGPAPEKAGRLYPRQSGSAEFLVEGLQEGLHVFDLDLTGSLEGLAAGVVQISGKAAGSVLVRNPKFSLAFSHPKTMRSGEPYTAYVTVLNTGSVEANLVSVSLRSASISGGTLKSPELVDLGHLAPGESATASFLVEAQRTGSVKFSNLTTSENSVEGRFNLTLGIDERGVELSPDTIAMPEDVQHLPPSVVEAANRVLGQALSAATAPLLPAGVKPVSRATIIQRVLELAEAGQRIKYLDATHRVLVDLMLDWQGGRRADDLKEFRGVEESLLEASTAPVRDDGFDQILQTTEVGRQFRAAVLRAAEADDGMDGTARLLARAADIAGRGESWLLASSSEPGLEIGATGAGGSASAVRSDLPGTAVYPGQRGNWLVVRAATNLVRWTTEVDLPQAEVAVARMGTNGMGQSWRWTVRDLPAGACLRFDPALAANGLFRDDDCDGQPDGTQVAIAQVVRELPLEILTVQQELDVIVSRPTPRCTPGPANNYGNVLGILFSKPMGQTNASKPTAYQLDNGTTDTNGAYASHVQIQPGGRIALVSMREGVSAIRPRHLTVTGVSDARGNEVIAIPHEIRTAFQDGVAVNGRVLRADGTPAAGVPVTVTMYDLFKDTFDRCYTRTTRTLQKYSDADGLFSFDFVHAGVWFTIAAVDTGGLTVEAIKTILDSSVGDHFAQEKLAALAAATNAFATLGVENLAQATRLVEGLDRAVWSDGIEYGGGRMGSEIVVGLRFRGRAVVSGTVVESNGVTPVPNAAVNLYPDPDSRELVRGVFTDSEGRFEFNGVPLGQFTINVQTSQRNFRTIAGNLTRVGTTNDYPIVLTPSEQQQEIVRSSISGRVVEPDGVTGHGQARVFVSSHATRGVVGAPTTDENGYWQVNDIPTGPVTVQAYSQDGRRRGLGRGEVVKDSLSFVLTALSGTGSVIGRVETSNGNAVANAIVAGGEALVRTDANGVFQLTGVPQGLAKLSAGWEPTTTNEFTRVASTMVNVLPEVTNFAVIRFPAVGRIIGRVIDATGRPVTGQNVAIPLDHGFAWTPLTADGLFEFPNLPVRDYIVSAPAPPVDINVDEVLDGAAGGTDDQIAAALRQAVSAIGQVTLRRLGDAPVTTPGSFGWTTARLGFDGDTARVLIRYLPEGRVSGQVLNDRGVPIGANVRLTGPGLDAIGKPATVPLGNQTSDPALGTFEFPRLPQGDWALQVASPFYPMVLVTNGVTVSDALSRSNVVLQFPPIRDFTGRLVGQVLLPDGSPAEEGFSVKISWGTNYVISTDTNGVFDTQVGLPANGYRVEVSGPDLAGTTQVLVKAGITNSTTVQLIGKGALAVSVVRADGTPAASVKVKADQAGFPEDSADGMTDASGRCVLTDLFAGQYTVSVEYTTGAGLLEAKTRVVVETGATSSAALTLGPTGTIRGIFRKREDGTPVAGAKVNIGRAAATGTDDQGAFQASGLPLGAYRVVAREPVSGRVAVAYATLAFDGQVVVVLLSELPQGELQGTVFQDGEAQPIGGALVTLSRDPSLFPPTTVTTGPDGGFSFPGVTPGEFSLAANKVYSLTESYSRLVTGNYPDNTATFRTDVSLPARKIYGRVTVEVHEPDGTPATNATVNGYSTDGSGRVVFDDLPLGTQIFRARSTLPNQTSSVGRTTVILTALQTNLTAKITLTGVGRIEGRVLQSDGVSPAGGAQVTAEGFRPELGGFYREQHLTQTNGEFSFENLPLAPIRLLAVQGSLTSSGSVTITNHGQVAEVVLRLGGSGSVVGRVLRADGTTVVPDCPVTLSFAAPSELDGTVTTLTDFQGRFQFEGVPIKPVELTLTAVQSEFEGLAIRRIVISANEEIVDVGDVILHEAWPEVTLIRPETGAQSVSTTTSVEITFSEPLATNSLFANGIYLRGPTNTVPCDLTWDIPTDGAEGTRTVRLIPKSPLESETTYRVYVLAGVVTDGLNRIIGRGPLSLVERPLLVPFSSSFTTRDDLPPSLVSIFPTNNATQVDPAAVVRLSFSEPISAGDVALTLRGPSGVVTGITNLLFGGTVLTFTPTHVLDLNSEYWLEVSRIRDLSGNALSGLPITNTFESLATRGPAITLKLPGEKTTAVAGSTVWLEAELASPRPGTTVRFTGDLDPLGTATQSPYRIPTIVPRSGRIIYRAIATDPFGNDGPLAELAVTVVPNAPPLVSLQRGTPTNEIVASGQNFSVVVSATDDVGVTNLAVRVSGALSAQTNFAGGSTNLVQFAVPSHAVADAPLHIEAQATDALGEVSTVATLSYRVADATPPELVILSPTNQATLSREVPLEIVVATSDNSPHLQLQLTLTGVLQGTQTLDLAVNPGQTLTNTFPVSLTDAPGNGGSLRATVRATDDASNHTEASGTWNLPDLQAPQLLAVNPTNGAVRQSLWPDPVSFRFSEALAAATVSTNTIWFTNNAALSVPYHIHFENTVVRVEPAALPLTPGVIYTNIVSPALSDAAGNPWVDQEGQAPRPEGAAFTFATASILGITPTNHTPVIAGQSVRVAVAYEPGLGATFFGFTLDSHSLTVTPGVSNVVAIFTLATNATTGLIRIEAQRSGRTPYRLPDLILDVRPIGGDEDGDGLPNDYELAHGLNPFADDASLDPDGDGLTNLEEYHYGTDPWLADTDGDGLSDGEEIAGGCPDPLNPDSDGDGLLDSVDPNPCGLTGGLVFDAPAEIILKEGTSTNVAVRALSEEAAVSVLDFDRENPPPLFARLTAWEFSGTATNGSAAATLSLSPTFDAAGLYTLTLRAEAENGASGVTQVQVRVLDNPDLQTTHWLGDTSGNWNFSSARWSEGVPDAAKIALIAEDGIYQVTLGSNPTVAGLVVGGESGTQTLFISGNQLTLDGVSEVRRNGVVQLTGGSITGRGLLTVGGHFNWEAGALAGITIPGPSRMVVQRGGRLDIRGPVNKILNSRELENDGTVALIGPYTLNVGINNGGIVNKPSGVVEAQNVTLQYTGGSFPSIINYGKWVVVGTNTVTVSGGLPFHNFGILTLTNGTLNLNGGGLHATKLEVGPEATLNLNSGSTTNFTTTQGSVLGGAGKIGFKGGTHVFEGEFLPTRPVTFEAGTITINNSLPTAVMTNVSATVNFNAAQQFDVFVLQNGTISGTGDLNLDGQSLWSGGMLSGLGRVVVASNATVQISGPAPKQLNRELDNHGTMTLMGPHTLNLGNGWIHNGPGGVVQAQNVTLQLGGRSSSITNQGTFVVVGTNAVTVTGGLSFHNFGAITLTNGSLHLNGSVTNHGSVTVSGAAELTYGNTVWFEPNTALTGDGVIRLRHAVRLAAPINFGDLTVIFEFGASLSGSFAIANDSGGTLVFDRFLTVPDSLTLAGTMVVSSNTTVTIGGTLTLESGSTLENYGTVSADKLVVHPPNRIIGNLPVERRPSPTALRIERISLIDASPSGARRERSASAHQAVLLQWQAAAGDRFVVEFTPDLKAWTALPVEVREPAPGVFEATLPAHDDGAGFYRLRRF